MSEGKGGQYGTLIMIAVIAAMFFFFSPGTIWNYSFVPGDGKNLVDTGDTTGTKPNKTQLATHAIAFGVIMTFAFPIIKETLGKM